MVVKRKLSIFRMLSQFFGDSRTASQDGYFSKIAWKKSILGAENRSRLFNQLHPSKPVSLKKTLVIQGIILMFKPYD